MIVISKKSMGIRGMANVPGDKSISHRAAMLLSISQGEAIIKNFLMSEDCLNTLRAMIMTGADIKIEKGKIIVRGRGRSGLKNPSSLVYLGNSGTSIRLLSGIFSGLKGTTILLGDNSLNKRPMDRIIEPLREMGANIKSIYDNGKAPLLISGSSLRGINYELKVASAQVKSSILLGSLFAEGHTTIIENRKSRDHTERMLSYLGCNIDVSDKIISMECGQKLYARDIEIPGDISSAAFLIGAALITPNSDLLIKNVLYNNTRTGFLEVVKDMGADIEISVPKMLNNEEVVDIRVKSSNLKGVNIGGDLIPRLIDEIPLIAVLASLADGKTIIYDAEELKHKESNRIKTTVNNLRLAGISAEETEDGMIIEGGCEILKNDLIFDSFMDHRIAMAFSLFGLILDNVRVLNCETIKTSFPNYVNLMNSIGANMITI